MTDTPAPAAPALPVMLSAEDQAAAAAAAATAAQEARAAGLASVKSFTASNPFKDVLALAKQIQSFMGGDPTVGAHINCMVQGMTTLSGSVASLT